MSTCGEGSGEKTTKCTEEAERVRDRCIEERDEGYDSCAQERTDRQKQCCDWFPCSLACKAFHWIVSVVCVAWEWISNVVCVAWETIKEVVCVAWIVLPTLVCHGIDALASALGFIVSIFEAAVGWAWSIVGSVFSGLLAALGLVGRLLSWVYEIGLTIVNTIISAPDMVLTLVGIMPEKKLRLGIIVLRDERDSPLTTGTPPAALADALLLRAIQCAINIYHAELNVRVVPIRYTNYKTSFEGREAATSDYIFKRKGPSETAVLDLCCEACGLGDDLRPSVGSKFQDIMNGATFWGNARRLIGYGAPIVAFTTRRFTGNVSGCSLGPLTDFVNVVFTDSNAGTPDADLDSSIRLDSISTLAHEMTHACNVVWHESGNGNLMSRLVSGPRTCKLTRIQKVLVRASRHVTYL